MSAARRTGPPGPRFQILGPLRLWRDGAELETGPPQQAHVLALLLAAAGRPVSTNDLVDLIWGEDAPASALNILHKYIGTLRRLLEPGLSPRASGSYLLRRGTGYLIAAGPDALDLARFRTLTRAAHAGRGAGNPADALDHYVEAIRLWHGSTGDALIRGAAGAPIATGLDGEFYAACAAAAELAATLGQAARVLPALRLAASMAPLHEQVQASLITALAADGQQAAALATFRAVRDRLAEELGIDPGPALRDAQRQVLERSVVPAGAAAPPAQLPPGLRTFVGRTSELVTLAELLARPRTGPLVVALHGMGGVGKSALTLRFAHQVAEEFPDGHLYLDLRGNTEPLTAGEALHGLSTSFGVPANVPATTGAYRSLIAGRRLLIVLDNAEDEAQVRPLLPNSPRCLVLVSGRTPLIGLAALDGAHLMHVDLPDAASAGALFRRRLDRPAEARVVDEIVDLCGRLPLALATLAGRLSARPRLSPAAVATELRHGPHRLAAFPSGPGMTDPRSTFTWSYQRLSPAAARLFRLFALTPAPAVTLAACASLGGERPSVIRPLLRELVEAGLLDEDDHGGYSAHVLVRACGEELLLAGEPAADRATAATRLLQHYLGSCFRVLSLLAPPPARVVPDPPLPGVVPEHPASAAEARQWFESHREVLCAAVRLAARAGAGVAAWQLAQVLGPLLRMSGRFDDWQEVVRVSLDAARAAGDRIGEAHVLRGLAGTRPALGEYRPTGT
ncbi:BTAD domain-containing putative transcriptional regulator [Actinoplanes sp. L3-i22]|uniref:AfsR/SARP family transcriptional regulator n=1 Tax=Actinoplanes sp. L3-i22 TaxID=2836373 RepID=UPI001C781D24|nr:BTAD domain-containing putative transcriptional regulator [Actinoplanes sp. L3-i22]BCY07255.1 hypothetical protein L3i22_023430 [Actinoplanes sp. L3-i22]